MRYASINVFTVRAGAMDAFIALQRTGFLPLLRQQRGLGYAQDHLAAMHGIVAGHGDLQDRPCVDGRRVGVQSARDSGASCGCAARSTSR